MRKRGRIDANQTAMVKALRQLPNTKVAILSSLGGGICDLLVGRPGWNVLLEVKDGSKSPSERKLTEDEQKFYHSWPGPKAIVENIDQALAIVKMTDIR